MKSLKKAVATLTTVAMLLPIAQGLNAEECYYAGGNCYQECRSAPCVAPAVALGAIALAAIIAVAVQRSNGDHGHCH